MGKQRLTDLVVQEVSLVDRPANPEARVSIWKREEGSVNPIKSAVDALKKAFRAESYDDVDKALATFEDALATEVDVGKTDADSNQEDTMDPTALAAMINKAVGDALAPVHAELAVLKMDPDMNGFMEKLSDEDRKSFMGMSMDERKKYMAGKMKKSDDTVDITKAVEDAVAKAVEPLRAENNRLAKALADQESAVRIGKLAEELVNAGVPKAEEMAKHLDSLPEVAHKALKDTLVATAKAAETAGLFREVGNSGEGAGNDPYAQLMAKAEELRKADPTLTKEQAFDKAYSNPANRELVQLYKMAR
jgi:hypothetical protein